MLILGNCVLFIDTLQSAFDIDVKGFKQRNIEKPSNEMVIKGPHEAFVENIRTNTSLIRKIINNENLTDDQKQEAVNQLVEMTNLAEKEAAAETLLASKGFTDSVVSLTSAGRLIQRLHHETGLSAVTDTPLHLIIGRAGLIDHHPFTSFKKFCIHRPISYAARGTTHSCRDTPAPDSGCRHERHP